MAGVAGGVRDVNVQGDIHEMKLILLAAAALAATATPALAQDRAPFTGAHVEGLVGYDKVDVNTAGLKNPDGLLYGVAAGYDVQFRSAVVGIEGEVSDSDARISAAGASVNTDRDLYVGGRVGFAVGRALVYGKAGYTNARFEARAGGVRADETLDGVRVGGGVEVGLTRNLFAKAEYRYSNYSDDVERHQAVGGVGIRF